jgi:hypothetical protein
MLTTCPIDGAKLIQHQSHRWPCMERGGCACPVVESCPECRARAIRAAEGAKGRSCPEEVAKLATSARMRGALENRAEKLKAAKARRAEQ